MFKMAFQVVFSAKNVSWFSFGLLVAPKLKKQGGAIMVLPGLNVFLEAGSDRVKMLKGDMISFQIVLFTFSSTTRSFFSHICNLMDFNEKKQ